MLGFWRGGAKILTDVSAGRWRDDFLSDSSIPGPKTLYWSDPKPFNQPGPGPKIPRHDNLQLIVTTIE
jgi:hypothetical protein